VKLTEKIERVFSSRAKPDAVVDMTGRSRSIQM
jgi:hypothetical protein